MHVCRRCVAPWVGAGGRGMRPAGTNGSSPGRNHGGWLVAMITVASLSLRLHCPQPQLISFRLYYLPLATRQAASETTNQPWRGNRQWQPPVHHHHHHTGQGGHQGAGDTSISSSSPRRLLLHVQQAQRQPLGSCRAVPIASCGALPSATNQPRSPLTCEKRSSLLVRVLLGMECNAMWWPALPVIPDRPCRNRLARPPPSDPDCAAARGVWTDRGLRVLVKALFSLGKILDFATVALSFVCGKYYLIID